MFWSKYKKKIDQLEQDVRFLMNRIEKMDDNYDKIKTNQDQINRIIKYSVPGKITHIHNVDLDLSNECIKRKTTIYKDFREYVIRDLPIDDDEEIFMEKDNPNLLFSIDNREKVKYIIDLNKCTFIKLPLKENK